MISNRVAVITPSTYRVADERLSLPFLRLCGVSCHRAKSKQQSLIQAEFGCASSGSHEGQHSQSHAAFRNWKFVVLGKHHEMFSRVIVLFREKLGPRL